MPSALIGRGPEIDELEARLRDRRLVTLVGPGGVGKTALAREVAGRVGATFPLGVRHADLTRVEDPRAVPGALAAQLGFDSFDALLSSPSDRPVLLVVDNCEHLLDATAESLLQVLGACRQPTVLATSRSPLELPGESVLPLAPLALPGPGDDLASCPSVQLFLQRSHDAGAAVSDADLPSVAELCRRLDGLPLAIEIAAARARTMSVAEIATRLGESADVLDRPRFRGDPRHRSVGETVRWSVDLLTPGVAELLEQLAVFAGPFSATTARAVVTGGDAEAAQRFDADLDELVHASLVSADTRAPETTYRLLDTVRRVALDRLRRRGGLEPAYDRFTDDVVRRSLEHLAGATASWRPGLLRDLVASFDDVAEALRWCNVHDDSPRRAHVLCTVLWSIVHQGHADDIAELARETLARWPRPSRGTAVVVAALATAEYVTGHPAEAAERAATALAWSTDLGAAAISLRRVLGQSRRALGDADGALEAFREGSAIGHERGMTAMAQELEVAAAQVIADTGRADEAAALLTALLTRTGDSAITRSWASTTLAWVTLRIDPLAARRLAGEALAEAQRIDYPIAVAVNLRTCAFAAILDGDLPAATAAVSALADDLLERGALSNARLLVDVAAVLAHAAGHPAGEVLAATARALPISTLASAQYELVPLPPATAPPLPRHDAVAAVRHLLAELGGDGPRPALEPRQAPGVPAPGAPGERATAAVRRRGDVVEFHFQHRTVGVRASKGVHDLVRLLEADGRELHCLELAGAGVEQSSTGEVIDGTARRRYEDRIRELQADIDEAEQHNDYGRAYRAQVELDALIEHLTAALGRGGRSRRSADSAERARSAVTHRVRATIRQIERLHPSLGRHLSHAINTGTYCSYRPEQPLTWDVG